MRYVTTKGDEATVVPGRRNFFEYFDHGVTDASDGFMRAQVIRPKEGLTQPTGWHYHNCDGQFVYVMSGWIRMEFDDGANITLNSGDSMFIPGGCVHQEAQTSDEFEALELSVPAVMGTVPVDVPAAFRTQG
jgi:mannose-6-phosphate isomerase-like protein (cupin superfamily)